MSYSFATHYLAHNAAKDVKAGMSLRMPSSDDNHDMPVPVARLNFQMEIMRLTSPQDRLPPLKCQTGVA